MRVLLTGATGFIGQYVARKLHAADIDFVTVGRTPNYVGREHIPADLLRATDYSQVVLSARATHLIHLAWYAEHGKYWSSPFNIDWLKATTDLVDTFCRLGGQHVTISGTCAEYDWTYGYCIEGVTPTNPSTIYGMAKDSTRRICQNICSQYAVPLAWGRIFFPYGRGEVTSRLLPSLSAVFQGKRDPFGINGTHYRDFLHVSDIASALMFLSVMEADDVINIASGEATRLQDVVQLLASKMSSDPRRILQLMPARIGEPAFLIGASGKLAALGWKKTVSLEQGLRDFFT